MLDVKKKSRFSSPDFSALNKQNEGKKIDIEAAKIAFEEGGYTPGKRDEALLSTLPEFPQKGISPINGHLLPVHRKRRQYVHIRITMAKETQASFQKIAVQNRLSSPKTLSFLLDSYDKLSGQKQSAEIPNYSEKKPLSADIVTTYSEKKRFWEFASEHELTFGNALEYLLFLYQGAGQGGHVS